MKGQFNKIQMLENICKVQALKKLSSLFHTLLQPAELFSHGSTWCFPDKLKYCFKHKLVCLKVFSQPEKIYGIN